MREPFEPCEIERKAVRITIEILKTVIIILFGIMVLAITA